MTETAKIAIDRFDEAVAESNYEDAWNAVVLVIHDVLDAVEVELLERVDFKVFEDVMLNVSKYVNKVYL